MERTQSDGDDGGAISCYSVHTALIRVEEDVDVRSKKQDISRRRPTHTDTETQTHTHLFQGSAGKQQESNN
jgi:hypothetical protein